MTNSNGIHVGLVKIADHFVKKVKEKLSGSGYPGDDKTGRGNIPIQDSIVIGQVESSGSQMSISVYIGNEKAPYARAYEYGSGIHATQGKAETYEIPPKSGKFGEKKLAFFWDNHGPDFPTGGKYYGVDKKTGKLLFWYVDHPGIEAKPYIRPTLEKEKDEMKKILGQEFKTEIIRSLKETLNDTSR